RLDKTERGNKRRLLVDHHVDGNTDQDFRGNIEQLVDGRTGDGGKDAWPVAAGVTQQATERLPTAGGRHGHSCTQGKRDRHGTAPRLAPPPAPPPPGRTLAKKP